MNNKSMLQTTRLILNNNTQRITVEMLHLAGDDSFLMAKLYISGERCFLISFNIISSYNER